MKIISFSVWGKNPKYTTSALINIDLAKEYYPDWKCRFYCDSTVDPNLLQLLKENAEVVMMPKSDGNYGLFWRFEPLADRSIERFIVRDTDSRLNPREAAAVVEWEESNYEFHLMRDHPQHNVPICGGLFGGTAQLIHRIDYHSLLHKYLSSLSFNELYKERGKYWNCDQPFLWKHIWPLIINSHIAHVKDHSLDITKRERLFTVSLPPGDFVGRDMDI